MGFQVYMFIFTVILWSCENKQKYMSNLLTKTQDKADNGFDTSATPYVRPIVFQIYSFSGIPEPSYHQVVADHHSALSGFVDLLRSQCQIDTVFTIPPPKELTIKPGASLFTSPRFQGLPQFDSELEFPFEFYQHQLYQLLQQIGPIERDRPSREVAIYMAEGLNGNCGFALPEVQFNQVPKTDRNKRIIDLLKNRLLINSAPQKRGECTNRSRILYHELGHIFVQDDPAHTCLGQDGCRRQCTKENLMASLVWVPLPPRPRDRSARSLGPDDARMRQIEAQGVSLNPDQCASIRQTISNFR
jgi:hypothetical protein